MGLLLGTLGDDTLRGTDGIDIVTALSGDDVVYGFAGADIIDGGTGNDTLYANNRTDWADGALDTVLGGAGDDHIYGGYGDVLNGGTGFDLLSLDLSSADEGVSANFKPMTLLDLGDLVTLDIGGTQLSGFQAVTDVIGSAFNDRIIMANSGGIGATVTAGDGDDRVRANGGEDRLFGEEGDDRLQGRGGADVLKGDEGDDRLAGGHGTDALTGGAGGDLFIFADRDSAGGRTRADSIADFSHAEGDRISLRQIDAITGGDDDHFTFIGTDRFSGTAGELRFGVVDGNTFVTGDIDGDGHSDFTIRLDGAMDLVRSDFQL